MNILHLGKYYAPIEGGVESINRVVVDSMKGNDQLIISFNNSNKTVCGVVDDVRIVRCSTFGEISSQPISFSYFFKIRDAIKVFKPDAIHLHYPNPLASLYLLPLIPKTCKLIVHWHSDIVAQSVGYKLIQWVEKRLLKRADKIIATSPNYIQGSFPLSRYLNKVVVIPCSINEGQFVMTPDVLRSAEDIKRRYGNKPIILFLGRHVEYKGLEYLMNAVQLMKSNAEILIAGNGPLTDSLKGRFKRPNVHWIGRISDSEKAAYYRAATVLAFPSITKNEAFGVVLAESMYCHCPPVVFTIPGSGVNWVTLDGVTGIEVPNKDIQQYALALDNIVSDSKLHDVLAANGVNRVTELFTSPKVMGLYQSLYQNIVNI